MSDARDPTAAAGNAGSALTQLHDTWLAALTGIHELRPEPKATCGDCVMCAGIERSGSHVTFTPGVKCCDYVPHLANFIVGQSLVGPGRDSIRLRIARRAGVTPLGLGLSYADICQLVAARSHPKDAPQVVCPHFDQDTRGCAIWHTRNAVCSTWFCQHERGAVSQRFWHAVRDLLIALEEHASHECLAACGLANEQMQAVLDHRAAVKDAVARANAGGEAHSDTAPDDESAAWYARMWGDWAGREEDWFIQCAESTKHVPALAHVARTEELRTLADTVRGCWRELNAHGAPDRLVFQPGAGSDATAHELRIVGYSPFDPLVLPAELLTDLRRLDGRPIEQVRAAIDRDGTRLTDELLEQLYDFGVAISPAP